MSKTRMIPLHRVAKELGYQSEAELLTILRLLPGLPYETRRGVMCADPDQLAEALAERGVIIPIDMAATNPSDDVEDQDEDEDEDEDEEDTPSRRRR